VPAERSMRGHVVSLLLALRYATPAFMPVLVRDALRMGPSTLWRAARDLLAEDIREDLRNVESPTLLVWGEKDPLVPPAVGNLLREEVPNSRLLLAFLAGESVGE
jgi:pimeloyl-ACP methyl ester carboxylesterase